MSEIQHSVRCCQTWAEQGQRFDDDCPACRIMKAAPKLLEACKAIQKGFWDGSIKFTKKRISDSDPFHKANTLICAAIAEAEPKGGYIEAIPETAAGHDKLREINTKLLEACKVAEESLLIYFETLKRNCAVSSLSKDDFEKISFAHHTINTVLAEAEPTKDEVQK